MDGGGDEMPGYMWMGRMRYMCTCGRKGVRYKGTCGWGE